MMTNKPKKQLSKAQREFSPVYKSGVFDSLLGQLDRYGMAIDTRICGMSGLFLLALFYLIPSVDSDSLLQMGLWGLSAISFSACLWLMVLCAKFSALFSYVRLEELMHEKKEKPLYGVGRIEKSAMIILVIGMLSLFAFIFSVFLTGGF